MAVYGIEGTPGSGKTLYVIAEFIAPFMARCDHLGRWIPTHIYHNLEGLKPEILAGIVGAPVALVSQYVHQLGAMVQEDGTIVEDINQVRYFYKQPKTGERLPDGSLIVIDEAQNYFSAREFKEKYSADLIPYISRHRHYRHTIVWITQKSEALDITFRRQTQYMYSLHRLENWGFKNTSRVEMYEGWNSTDTPPFAKVNFKFPAKFYRTYESYATDDNSDGKEYRRSYNLILHNKGLITIAVVIFLLAIYLIFFAHPMDSLTQKKAIEKNKAALQQPQAHSEAHASPQNGVAPVGAQVGDNSLDSLSSDSLCYTNIQVINGVFLYTLNNGEKERAGQKNYKKCKRG